MASPLPTLRRRRLGAVVVALSIVAAACAGGDDDVAVISADEPTRTLEDLQADVDPRASVDIAYLTLTGSEASLSDFVGTPLVVNFFAAWCASCVSEMPDFEAAFQGRGGEVAFLGISEDARASDSLDLVDETGITYATGWDPDGEIFASFGGFTMPTTVFIDAEGEIVEMFSGALTRDRLDSLIDEHLL